MQITKRTRLRKVLPLLIDKERVDTLIDSVDEYPLKKKILSMTVGEFIDLVTDEDKFISSLLNPRERAYKALGRLKAYRNQMEQLMSWIKKFHVKQSMQEKNAAQGITFPDFCSRILLTVTDYFHLKSFKEAEKVPLADYLLILQDQSTSIQYQRAYQRIIELEQKSKSKKK